MVERLRQFFAQFRMQAGQFWSGLTKGRRIALGVALAVVFLGLLSISLWRPEKTMETAYTQLSQEDKTAILAFLSKEKITDFRMEGDSVQFPSEKLLEYKMKLAQEGLPNAGVGVGWEKWDENELGMSDEKMRINRLRSIQGELSRTINKLDPVENSRVHIVMPHETVFKEDKKVATASVYVKLKPNKSLNPRQLQGVLHLVARAVEGLDPRNIAVVDHDGNMLTAPEEEDGGLDRITSTQREYQKRLEKELEQKIRDILSRLVGNDKVVAKVQAEVDFKKVETTVQDIDPERSAVVSQQRSEQSSSGSGFNPTGVPGAKSNLPGEKEDANSGGGSSSNSKSTSETTNYESKKTLSKIVEPIGSLSRLSIAVLVDGRLVDGKVQPRDEAEMAKITKLVKNATGFVEKRDAITVETAQFEPDEFQVAEQAFLSQRRTSLFQTGIISTVAIAGMLFLFFAVVKPYFKWLTFDPEKRSQENFSVVDYELERSGGAARRVQVQEEVPFEKLSPKEQIMYLAKHDPKKTTEAIRQLLNPNQSG